VAFSYSYELQCYGCYSYSPIGYILTSVANTSAFAKICMPIDEAHVIV